MTLRIRFEAIPARHRPEARNQRAASPHWRGRAVDGARKRHIRCVSEPVRLGQVRPFLARAELVLRELGGTDPEIRLALDQAERFLRDRLPKVVRGPPPDAKTRDWARLALERHQRRGDRGR